MKNKVNYLLSYKIMQCTNLHQQGRALEGGGGGGGANDVLCNTCSVLLCVFEQPRVDYASAWPNWSNWLKSGPVHQYLVELIESLIIIDNRVVEPNYDW